MTDSFFSNRLPRGPNPLAFTRDAIDEQLSRAELRRPVHVIIPPELFTERVASAGPSLANIADALIEDQLERARLHSPPTTSAPPLSTPLDLAPLQPTPFDSSQLLSTPLGSSQLLSTPLDSSQLPESNEEPKRV